MKRVVLAIAACACTLAGVPVRADALWPLPDVPVRVMNTISTLQFYGPTPGFHHGLDLAAPPGTMVHAPVSGWVETGYYYRRQSDYTYEIAITTDTGERWELHHIDPDEIPPRIQDLAATGGRVEAGDLLGGIYDASEIGIEPHVHINLLGPDGVYRDPSKVLPDFGDGSPPRVQAAWWVRREGDRLFEVPAGEGGLSAVLIDAMDIAPGGLGPQSVQSMTVTRGGETLFNFDLAMLPSPSFLEGVEEIYFLGDFVRADGTVLRSGTAENRRFLYEVHVDATAAEERLEITLRDASGNLSRQTLLVEKQ